MKCKITGKKMPEGGLGIKSLDEQLAMVSDFIDPVPIEVEIETMFGPVKLWGFQLLHTINKKVLQLTGENDNSPVKQFNAPPLMTVDFSHGNSTITIGDDDEPSWRRGVYIPRMYNKEQKRSVIMYNPDKKYESVIGLLTFLLMCGHEEATGPLKVVIFEALNRKFNVGTGSVELAGEETIVKNIMQTLCSRDPRLVNRHILLSGPPGCGKSEIIKKVIQKTPDWIHYSMSSDISNWANLMFAIDTLMKFLNKRLLIVIDEIDEIGLHRDKNHKIVYNLLRIMDGVSDITNIKFIATTNRPKDLDPALLRFGRFGPVIAMSAPSAETYKDIVKFYNKRYGGDVAPDVLHDACPSAVGCDIRAAFENCIIHNEPVTTPNVRNHLAAILDIQKEFGDL